MKNNANFSITVQNIERHLREIYPPHVHARLEYGPGLQSIVWTGQRLVYQFRNTLRDKWSNLYLASVNPDEVFGHVPGQTSSSSAATERPSDETIRTRVNVIMDTLMQLLAERNASATYESAFREWAESTSRPWNE